MGAGDSKSSPLPVGLGCQVSGMACSVPSPTRMRKSSSECTWMASTLAIIGLRFPIIAIIVHIWVAASLNLRAADHGLMILRDKANSRSAREAYVDCIRAAIVSIRALLSNYWLYCDYLNYYCEYFETRLRLRRGKVATALEAGGWDQQRQPSPTPQRSRRGWQRRWRRRGAGSGRCGGDQKRQFSILGHMFLSLGKTDCFIVVRAYVVPIQQYIVCDDANVIEVHWRRMSM
jgi:hypothetical protein